MFAFFETAETGAWHPGDAKPAVVLFMLGQPNFEVDPVERTPVGLECKSSKERIHDAQDPSALGGGVPDGSHSAGPHERAEQDGDCARSGHLPRGVTGLGASSGARRR